MIPLLLAAALATTTPPLSDARLRCLGETFASELGAGATWPVADALPSGPALAYVALPTVPADASYDAVRYELRVYAGDIAFVAASGGISDTRSFRGPIPLQGRCAGATGAP